MCKKVYIAGTSEENLYYNYKTYVCWYILLYEYYICEIMNSSLVYKLLHNIVFLYTSTSRLSEQELYSFAINI